MKFNNIVIPAKLVFDSDRGGGTITIHKSPFTNYHQKRGPYRIGIGPA